MKSINHHFFETLKLLKQRYQEKPKYNLFRVLRSESDEVRLHSRFICDLLNPRGHHHHASSFLKLFLQQIEINLDFNKAQVLSEYQNIDILIKDGDKAIIIENKIYACDQERQLERYYEIARSEGYQDEDITLIYLTLEGREADEYSAGNLADRVILLSYQNDICYWLDKSIAQAARDAPLREALIQYLDLVHKLTHQTDNMEYLEHLKRLLLTENLLDIVPDIQQAYEAINIDAQVSMWLMLADKMKIEFGSLTDDSISNSADIRKQVQAYIHKKKNSRYQGLWIKLGGYSSAYLGIEQDHHLYYGVWAHDEKDREFLNPLLAGHDSSTPYWALWRYPASNFPFRDLDSASLKKLSSQDELERYTDSIIAGLKEIKSLLDSKPTNTDV
ncbi:PD-(D/E)XK nuclease family protein (plasmid) [Vibrio gigantis]|uniref:PDDEXK-like family protein n=1 Tax=Vibrio gigantis TaxID=296199 RepID=UPI001EFB2CC2|nr:PD-(D/E)XK nuclease family protein [Vibrio gigantis]ULN67390.1 PD-(D/E)XK nuclease family protein [Vibrio gigantis]